MPEFIKNPWLLLLLYICWVIPWKGVSLWKAANRKELYWFIAMLVINTAGVLEILYYYVFSNDEIMKKLRDRFSSKNDKSDSGQSLPTDSAKKN